MLRTTSRVAALAVAALLAVSGCTSSQPARLDPSQEADEHSLLAEPAVTAEATFDTPDDEHAAVGELADGFPADLVPLPADAQILVSSAEVDADGGTTTLSLNLRTAVEATTLMTDLRRALTDAGFTEAPVATPPVGVAAESTFARRSGEVLTVAVLDRDGVRTLTLGGRVVVP
ncbi:hypothetical protein [Cellulomonas sp. PSBB021]|uniref:hypothetical protein n=1 Tax=Cellulomonas sp. PSBB021 TaxID=2003551 RepID=UPI000B8D21A9|nr:hypothetical protein [Cellulomonas sp. PSBB021]ASR54721.1 hypothetical protein CBP52_05910 [Cellulomonas sp. PSBB021]